MYMCCENTDRSSFDNGHTQCCARRRHHGSERPIFLSKKKQIESLEKQLAGMKEQMEDLEMYISELKTG